MGLRRNEKLVGGNDGGSVRSGKRVHSETVTLPKLFRQSGNSVRK
jgi:hypothetical protein